ncbi:hypothetical protein FS837_002892 [Tulasnella sp. UAMH 9824]|nr:hypothetical protein FS837_002892 [Tulasnella sp. UAMH 9824]
MSTKLFSTPSLTSSTSSTPPTLVRSLQLISELEAAKRNIAELEATISERRFKHAAYVQKVERMNMPYTMKKLTEERDLFRSRLEPAKREFARKAAERQQVEQEWKEEVDRRITAQLRVLGAKYGLEESAKQYPELEAKYLELQKRPLSA